MSTEYLYKEKVYSGLNRPLLEYVAGTNLKILDVGCGTGDALKIFRDCGHDAVGITLSDSEASRATVAGLSVLVANCDEELPFEEACFDVIFMNHVVEHLPDPVETLRKLSKYLKAEGRFLIAVPNMAFIKPRIQFMLGRIPQDTQGFFDRTHLRFFTYKTIRENTEAAGLTIVIHKSVGRIVPSKLGRLMPSFFRGVDTIAGKVAPNLFGREIVIVAVK